MAIARGADKWKMKKWFSVYAPKVFNDALVGEMPANDEKAAIGRNIIVSLDYITHNPSHAYTNVILKVSDVNGESAHTKLVGMELLNSYIRSFVRRYKSVSSVVVPVVTKDNVSLVAKVMAITKMRTARTKIVGVRKDMIAYTAKYFSENDLDAAVNSIMEGKFQAELASSLRHITDLQKVEVRKLEIK